MQWLGRWTYDFQFPVMTLPGYFWDTRPYFAGKRSSDITTIHVNSALHPSGVTKSSTSYDWGKGEKVTAARWQVTLCDLIWHVISHSGEVISTNCCVLYLYWKFANYSCYIFDRSYVVSTNLSISLQFCYLLYIVCWIIDIYQVGSTCEFEFEYLWQLRTNINYYFWHGEPSCNGMVLSAVKYNILFYFLARLGSCAIK